MIASDIASAYTAIKALSVHLGGPFRPDFHLTLDLVQYVSLGQRQNRTRLETVLLLHTIGA
jgi:hypothetical protein